MKRRSSIRVWFALAFAAASIFSSRGGVECEAAPVGATRFDLPRQAEVLRKRNRRRAIGAVARAARLPAIAVLAIATLLLTLPPGQRPHDAEAADIPVTGSAAFIQTSGPNAGRGVGDYYTSVNGGNDPLGHRTEIVVPCAWPSATPITIALFDPEVQTPDPVAPTAIDEIRGSADNTTYTLTAPGGAIVGPVTYTPAGGSNQRWVELTTFLTSTPGYGCGTYVLRNTTSNDDDNAWRLRVSHDPDCTPTPGPCTGIGAAQSALLDNGNQTDDP